MDRIFLLMRPLLVIYCVVFFITLHSVKKTRRVDENIMSWRAVGSSSAMQRLIIEIEPGCHADFQLSEQTL